MRIFVLDDMEERLMNFRKWYGHHDYVEAKKAREAINVLANSSPFDLYFLDHDLNDDHYNDGSGGMYSGYCSGSSWGTGYDVCRYIVSELPVDKRPKRIVVHSWNPDGAKRMAQLLAESDIPVELCLFRAGMRFLDPERLVA